MIYSYYREIFALFLENFEGILLIYSNMQLLIIIV